MISRKKIVVLVILIAVALFVVLKTKDNAPTGSKTKAYVVKERDMLINVVENGTIEPYDAYVLKSKVEGSATIISIVQEGEIITQEDIDNEKILVELDSSGLEDKISQQEITLNSAKASLTEARESLDIQKNQNDSDLQQGRLKVQFALMDLQKYLGEQLAERIIDENIYEKDAVFIGSLIEDENIGGESLQRKRELQSNIDLSMEELERAQDDLVWTQRLAEKNYVAGSDLKADQLKAKRLEVDVERAQTNLDLFERYEFSKQARTLISDYEEAKRELERIEARTRSRLAQAEAKLNSQEATFRLQKEKFDKLKRQIEACVMRAEVPGMVVYASDNRRWGGSRTSIEQGASVRERQEILTIPDPSKMAVNIKIHEASIDKVDVGQKARITIDAMPELEYDGTVKKISPLPDPQNFLSNPDMKVYSTEVAIDGDFHGIRPGMSAKVNIIIERLENVIAVPIQCVGTRGGRKVCYVLKDGKPEMVDVETGSYNDSFVHIISGLEPSERVLLTIPKLYGGEGAKDPKEAIEQMGEVDEVEEVDDSEIEPVTPKAQPEVEQTEPQSEQQPKGKPDNAGGSPPKGKMKGGGGV